MPDYPEDLDHPISRGDLSLLGVGWREVAGPLWRSPYRGVHVWAATEADDPHQRALDAAGLLPSRGALGGWAAARVGGVVELDGWSGPCRLPVPLCLPPNITRRRGPRVVAWRAPYDESDVTTVGGVRVTTPVRTAFDLARSGCLLDAVTALDVLGRGRPDFLGAVTRYVEERAGWQGVVQARRALALSSPRVRSPRETALRLFWTLECGLPDPQVNPLVLDPAGRLLGMTDLLEPGCGLVGEYDGSGHRAAVQHAADNVREEGLEDAGLTVVRVTHLDLVRTRSRTRARLLAGRRRALGTPAGGWTWQVGPLPEPVPHW